MNITSESVLTLKHMILSHRIEFGALILIIAIIINLLLRIKSVAKFVSNVLEDTLKVDDGKGVRRYSGTKITQVVAFGSILWAFHFDTMSNARADLTLFGFMGAIATGIGIAKAYGKKLDPEVVAPDSQTTIKQETTKGSSETTIKDETLS